VGALDGKIAAITGASAGTGLGIATRFAAEGATVYLLAREPERLRRVTEAIDGDTIGISCDISDAASVDAAFAEIGDAHGKLDVLINNAAIYRPTAVEHLSTEDIDRQVGTNLLGPVFTCRAAIPLLRAAGGGDIINTSSESTLHPFPLLAIYVATKAGLEAFSEVLAAELMDDDIRVTSLVQGTATGTGGGSTGWEWDPETTGEAFALWEQRGLLLAAQGRLGGQAPEDVAEVHLFIVTRPRQQKLDRIHVRSF
jgi:NAD(P)-dependent dehydrogenase (short-subunit alcohol dehydrogenase family)